MLGVVTPAAVALVTDLAPVVTAVTAVDDKPAVEGGVAAAACPASGKALAAGGVASAGRRLIRLARAPSHPHAHTKIARTHAAIRAALRGPDRDLSSPTEKLN